MVDRESQAANWTLALWLGAQLAAIAVAAARVPLWARVPPTVEQLALTILVATQIGAASLLFPNLVRGKSTLLIAIATAWPLAELATFLADAAPSQLVAQEAYVSVWLVVLHVWAGNLRGIAAELLGAAIAVMLSFGGVLLVYFHGDFGDTSPLAHWPRQELLGPIMGAVGQVGPPPVALGAWFLPGALLGVGLLARLQIARKNRGKQARVIVS
jgi:hypothetical protein